MPGKRIQTLNRLLTWIDPIPWEIVDELYGWPSLIRVQAAGAWVPLAVHVGSIGRSHRGRDAVERRFQNPGQSKPIVVPRGYLPLLIGLWEQGVHPVLVAMDVEHRVAKDTRMSLFIPLALLQQASQDGWAQQANAAGEVLFAFHPQRLLDLLHLL